MSGQQTVDAAIKSMVNLMELYEGKLWTIRAVENLFKVAAAGSTSRTQSAT